MDIFADIFHYAWSFVVILSVIVFIHEFGHYIIAKWCGVKIDVFSIGFGHEIFGWNDRTGTRWKVSMLPFGGYVKMHGDQGAASTPDNEKIETMSEEEKRQSFHFKPLWQKMAIVAAGPMANFLLTIAIFTYFVYSSGLSSTAPVVGEIIEDTPAAEAGLQAGDRVLSVDGKEVDTFSDIANAVVTNLGTPVELLIERNDENMTVSLTPMEWEETDQLGNTIKRPLIGFRSQELTYTDVSFPQAVGEAVGRTYHLCVTSLEVVGQIVTGNRTASELKGPVGIAHLSGQVTQSGDTWQQTFRMILWFIALLSVNLGLINLFPIPLLDGGHLMYYLVEAVQGRPMAQQFQEWGFRLGFAIIITLMAFTLYNDIANFWL